MKKRKKRTDLVLISLHIPKTHKDIINETTKTGEKYQNMSHMIRVAIEKLLKEEKLI